MGNILYKIRERQDDLAEELKTLEATIPMTKDVEDKIKALKKELSTYTSGPLNNNRLNH